MTDWIDQYSAALDIRDAREKAHKPYIDAYTRLADRTTTSTTLNPTSSTDPTSSPTPTAPNNDDLLTSQRARSHLQSQLSTLTHSHTTLQKSYQLSTQQISTLTIQKTALERRVRDLSSEISSKRKLVEDTQDEMVSLQLQLSMAEQRSEKLEGENRELVDRWMKRMGEEAEKVNRESQWE